MATTLATQVDASASQQALAGGGGRRGRTAACSSFLFDLRQAPAIHKLSVSGFCRRSKRRVSFCSAMPSWRVNEPSDFREGVLSSIVNTVKKSPYDTDSRHASLLEKEDKKADIVTMVLQERQCEIEPKFKIGDRIYTRVEKEVMQMPFWKKLWLGLNFQKITKPMESSRSVLEQKASEQMWGDDVPASSTAENPVYLSEILREYKGKLYVPEEAFRSHDSEVEDYKSSLLALPRISYEDFVKAMRSNRIELLTCRGVSANSGTHKYREFIVDLKGVDGEEATKWSMHLFKEEAEAIMKEYAGPQVEVETHYTPYVVPPSKSPLPAASSISGRIMLELAAAAGLITTVAYTLCGAASAAALMLASAGVVVVTHVLWPIASPLLWPISTLFATLGKIIWAFAFGSSLERGALVNMAQYVSSGSFNVNLRTFGAIVFVVTLMAFLAKYTLTRRSKDFTKWDLWQAIEFGHSKPQARVEGSTGVGFEDVAGIDDVVHELQQLVNYLKNPDQYDLMGTKPPHGVLLEGPPGCGKTLVAKAIAGEAGVPFFQMAGSEFVEVLVGVGAARIRDLFKRAKVNRPAVVFIDEIDALGAMRHIGGGVGGKKNNGLGEYHAGSQERETTLNQLLIELDGFDTGQGVVFLAATNRMDMLDPALLRPGRFDRKIIVKPPNVKGRFEILKVHAKDVKLSPEVDLWMLAKNLPGWTGADLAQLLQEGALLAVRNGHNSIIQEDLSLAMERITLGIETSGLGYGLPIHQRLATIEVGIAITSHLLRRLENAKLEFCNRISIVPRGKTLSCTIFERLEDEAYYFERRPQLFHRLQVLLGGRAAEETMFGRETSNLSLTYLADASWMARKLVSIWNLEGPLTVRGEEVPWGREYDATGPPLDFEGFLYEDHGWSEPSMNPRIDSQVARWSDALLNRFYDVTLSMLRQHKAALTKAIHVVMDKHELCGEDLELILDCYPAGTPLELLKNEKDLGALPKKPSVASLSDGRSGEKISFGTKLIEAIDMNSN